MPPTLFCSARKAVCVLHDGSNQAVRVCARGSRYWAQSHTYSRRQRNSGTATTRHRPRRSPDQQRPLRTRSLRTHGLCSSSAGEFIRSVLLSHLLGHSRMLFWVYLKMNARTRTRVSDAKYAVRYVCMRILHIQLITRRTLRCSFYSPFIYGLQCRVRTCITPL